MMQQQQQQQPSMAAAPAGPQQQAAAGDELVRMRHMMRNKILEFLQRKMQSTPNLQIRSTLADTTNRIEEKIFRTCTNKNDYWNKLQGDITVLLHNTVGSGSSHRISSSSAYGGTMIPTPGMTQNASGNSSVVPGMVSNTGNVGGMMSATNNLNGVGQGKISNGYQQVSANSSLNSVGNSIASSIGAQRPQPQMIPTPGLSNQRNFASISEYSNGVGYINAETAMASHLQQQRQLAMNQGNHSVLHPGSQVSGSAISAGTPKISPYGISDAVINGTGVMGSNMPLANGPSMSDGYINVPSYTNSPKGVQQNHNQQHSQLNRISASVNQQVVPSAVGDANAVKLEASGPGTFFSSAATSLSPASGMSRNTASLQTNPRANVSFGSHQSSVPPMYQQSLAKNLILENHDQANLQSSQFSVEQLMNHQRYGQQHNMQSNKSPYQFVHSQNQLLQQHQTLPHQQPVMNNNSSRLSSLGLSHAEKAMPELTAQAPNGIPSSHANEQSQRSDVQQKALYGSARGGLLNDHVSESHHLHLPAQDSQYLLPPPKQSGEVLGDVNNILRDQSLNAQWQAQSLENTLMSNNSFDKRIQEDLRRRTMGQDEAQQPFSPSEHLFNGCAATPVGSVAYKIPAKGSDYHNQLRFFLLIQHARNCPYPSGTCPEINCARVQVLLSHIKTCSVKDCKYDYCRPSKSLINHRRSCSNEDCPLCNGLKACIAKMKEQTFRTAHESKVAEQHKLSQKSVGGSEIDRMEVEAYPQEAIEEQPSKRFRTTHTPNHVSTKDLSSVPVSLTKPLSVLHDVRREPVDHKSITLLPNSEVDTMSDSLPGQEKVNLTAYGVKAPTSKHEFSSSGLIKAEPYVKQEKIAVEVRAEAKHDIKDPAAEPAVSSKTGKPKIKGVSLIELFTPEQINEHIISLRQWVGQSKAKAEKNQALEHSMNENACQLCAVEKLTFDPPPIYCSPCGARIKRNHIYYTGGASDTRHYFCALCYSDARGDTIEVDGSLFTKSKLEKKKNDEETEEWWVQCDKCESWQHQICALFNGRRNDGEAEYTCPNCCVEETKRGERKLLPQSAVLGAKDLPRTILSDHIEDRLFRKLKDERQERAKLQKKSYDEVPGAEGLVVRVVSSVDKKLEVKPRFLEIFQEENYPTDFPYKSKAVLLFQKIEGVEVCLFGMYVQEFGAEAAFPNQRRVYLSYLDSVKYFRPEIKTVSGEALRTFVYHEILIGYLEYCKIRGFTSCYIWACPPLKGEDYILYCHPEIQKTPKSDKLREWYLAMLRKASHESIVVELTNLYDHFFVPTPEGKAKVTAARLPYFEGDYWPGAAEDMINVLRQEEDDSKQMKKGKTKKTITKRALKAAGHTNLSGNASKDALLMQKLGETIHPMKEDFIMVHLQYSCSHCCILMVSGKRWRCNQCKNFQLCDRCHDAEEMRDERERHPVNGRDKHTLWPVEITGVPEDTKDRDDILESEFFDTRQAFLSLCQGNHYQYDTLRRAKHSSMMVLYHLHNPTAPAFVTSCNMCQRDIENGQGWRCEVCPDFDVCNTCYQKDGCANHPHKLTNNPSTADRDAQNKEARQKRVVQLRKMLDLLVHASQCRTPSCQYPNCRKVKGLFRHGNTCRTRASGGCFLCKRMWYILHLHARACRETTCSVPRCRDLREHFRRLQQQSDSRRRAAVNEMMRQRAAEVANNME